MSACILAATRCHRFESLTCTATAAGGEMSENTMLMRADDLRPETRSAIQIIFN